MKKFENIDEIINHIHELDNEEETLELINYLKNYGPETEDDPISTIKSLFDENEWDIHRVKEALDNSDSNITYKLERKKNKALKVKQIKQVALATAAILVLFFSVYSLNDNNSKIDRYYTSNSPMPDYLVEDSKMKWKKSMQYFNNENYHKILLTLDNKNIDNNNDTLNYLKALSLYEENNVDAAANHFKKVTENSESVFYDEAHFKYAISLYKSDELAKAKKKFKKIAEDTNNPYSEKSNKILKEFFDQ